MSTLSTKPPSGKPVKKDPPKREPGGSSAQAEAPQGEHSAFKLRLRRVREAMGAQELSHLLITSPLDVGYLTGFLGGDSYLVLGPGRPVLISDFRYEEELAEFESLCQIVIRKRSMGEALAELLSGEGVERVGIQAEVMTVAERDALAKRIGTKRVAATMGLIMRMRAVKDAAEVALIRRAVKIQEDALKALLPTLEPGLTELEVAARLEAEMKNRGSSKPSFETIIAARANGSMAHYRPGSTKLAANQPVLIDWGAIWQGYHSDMTRTFTLGKWPKPIAEIYPIVLEAHQRAAAAIAPGKSTSEIDKIARDFIAAAGYGENFGHGLGHGIGLQTHEDPRLSHMLTGTRLEAGHVCTVEPGIYLPGVGGVRLENDYVVEADGAKNLCSLPMTMDWATLR
ncbi:MAG: aminopeptidase P family protein [Phycisphaerae bacterium]|nr:aminopeptidase P family protein [Phycisphaerae bacterium]MBN8596172.1 aminopeptidase P family protein [Planctomycetota bacterium]